MGVSNLRHVTEPLLAAHEQRSTEQSGVSKLDHDRTDCQRNSGHYTVLIHSPKTLARKVEL